MGGGVGTTGVGRLGVGGGVGGLGVGGGVGSAVHAGVHTMAEMPGWPPVSWPPYLR